MVSKIANQGVMDRRKKRRNNDAKHQNNKSRIIVEYANEDSSSAKKRAEQEITFRNINTIKVENIFLVEKNLLRDQAR